MKNLVLITMILSSFSFSYSQEDERLLDPRYYDVWTIEDLGYKDLIVGSINDFIAGNPSDSLPRIESNQRIVIIVKKTDADVIFQLRYGTSKPYQILNANYVKWALSKRLRYEIIGGDNKRKDYYYINNKIYITNATSEPEFDYFNDRENWSVRDVYVSLLSPAGSDRIDIKASSLSGLKVLKTYALSLRTGDKLLGYPDISQGHMKVGILNPSFELGMQIPVLEKAYSPIGINVADSSKVLSGGIGGYARVNLFGTTLNLSYSNLSENQFVTERLIDSTAIDYMRYSFIFYRSVSSTALGKGGKYGMLNVRGGFGTYEVSHQSLNSKGVYEDRIRSKDGNILESPKTTFMGPMLRFDYISKLKNETAFPLLEFFGQVNLYKNNSIALAGLSINLNNFGIDATHRYSLEDFDWSPKGGQTFVSFNYYYDRKN